MCAKGVLATKNFPIKKGVYLAMNKKAKKKIWRPATSRLPTTNPRPICDKRSLRFTPTAWAKLLFLRDYGDTEVGGFGVTSSENLLLVDDICLVHQTCSYAYVAFDDDSVADFYDQQVDIGKQPEQFSRIWIHTHPADSPMPSSVDEETFARVFGRSDWALMFILAREGQSYARLRFNTGPGGEVKLPVEVDYSRPFSGSRFPEWEREYLSCVQQAETNMAVSHSASSGLSLSGPMPDYEWYDNWDEYIHDDAETEGNIE
jgi:proteasome lid subunit RPN8/RPN11